MNSNENKNAQQTSTLNNDNESDSSEADIYEEIFSRINDDVLAKPVNSLINDQLYTPHEHQLMLQ